jgi:hypothetical protein
MRKPIALAVASVAVVQATAAFAGGGSIVLDQPAPAFGDSITFSVSLPGSVKFPVDEVVTCAPDGAAIWKSEPLFSAADKPVFVLGGSGWQDGSGNPAVWDSGGASCTAYVAQATRNGVRTYAQIYFSVAG